MSRHRNIRTLDYEEEYNEYYDEYSRSVDDDYTVSPSTANEYLYKDIISEKDESKNDDEICEESEVAIIDAKMYSCIESIQDVVGETIVEQDIIAAIKKANYNAELALDMLLNGKKSTAAVPLKGLEHNSDSLSKAFIALATHNHFNNTDDNSIDFSCYDFRKYIKDFFMKSLIFYHKTIESRESSKSKLNTTLDVKPIPKTPQLTRTTPSVDSSKTKKITEIKKESPSVTPKNLKNIKQKSPEEILKLYNQNRTGSKLYLNMVIVGHVDAGKSTMIGHLLSLLGIVSKKSMHKNEVEAKKVGKASFMYAWILDETEEERSRGITIDIGQYRFETDNRIITILDAPGHRDFIPNMIAGATKADVAILVVDATNGEFETGFESGGQTQEHTLLLRSLGISQIAVAVNKIDNVKFAEDRYLGIVEKLGKFLKQAGFKDNNIHYIPCSGLTGDNLIHSSKNPAFKWFQGESLIEIIDKFKPNERLVNKPFRMSINDIFKGPTSGICFAGKIDAGYVEASQKLLIKPLNEICTVKSIFCEDESQSYAFAGDVVTINVLVSEASEISIGNVLCDLTFSCTLATKFEARVVIFSNVDQIIVNGFSVVLYSVCLNEVAQISKLCSQIDKNTNETIKRNPRILVKNNSAIVQFTTNRPICIETYKDFKEYGRFIFRSGNATIGAGLVTKIIS